MKRNISLLADSQLIFTFSDRNLKTISSNTVSDFLSMLNKNRRQALHIFGKVLKNIPSSIPEIFKEHLH